MLALSLFQPWAILTMVADPASRRPLANAPAKQWETRPWKPHAAAVGQRIAIHATAGMSAALRRTLAPGGEFVDPWRTILLRCGVLPIDPYAKGYNPQRGLRMHAGAVIGSAILEFFVRTDDAHPWISTSKLGTADKAEAFRTEFFLGNYAEGRYAWRLSDPIALREPIPCAGAQRLWKLPPDVERAVLRSVPAPRSALAGAVVRG